jgi:pectate lyase
MLIFTNLYLWNQIDVYLIYINKEMIIMRKFMLILATLVFLFVSGCSIGGADKNSQNVTPNPGTGTTNTDNQNKTDTDKNDSGGITKVKIFLIALEDNGKSGKDIGTGDSAVPVEVTVPPTKAPLSAAINQLLSIKDRNYGQSGLYNPLYQSNLKLDSASIKGDEAEIRLSGTLQLGGVMDDPRVIAQFRETALQFSNIKKVSVYLNNKKLEDVLSEKGE